MERMEIELRESVERSFFSDHQLARLIHQIKRSVMLIDSLAILKTDILLGAHAEISSSKLVGSQPSSKRALSDRSRLHKLLSIRVLTCSYPDGGIHFSYVKRLIKILISNPKILYHPNALTLPSKPGSVTFKR